jgi:hypothetical protein
MKFRSLLVLPLALSGCSGTAPEDETHALRDVLAGEEVAKSEVPQLNRVLVRRAVRAGSYAELEAQAPVDEAWSPVVTIGAEGPTPLSVAPWLEAGLVDPSGAFVPCHEESPGAPPLDEASRAALEARAPGASSSAQVACVTAAARLLAPDYEPRWVSAADHAVALYPDERRIEINAALIELVGSSEIEALAPVEASATPPATPIATTETSEIAPPGLVLRSHEPPPGYEESSDDDCDCDAFDCNGSNRSNSCAVTRRPRDSEGRRVANTPLWLLVAAGLLALRREARSRASGSRARRFGPLFLFALSWLSAPEALAEPANATTRLEAGKRLLAKKDPAAALVELEAARREGAGIEVLEPLARAYRDVGRLPEAYVTLSELVLRNEQAKVPPEPRHAQALRELEGELAFVTAEVTPPEAALFVDGQPAAVDPRSRRLVVTHGPHTISASREGYAPAEQTLSAERGSGSAVVELSLAPNGARVVVEGFAPDAIIALDGTPLTQGRWEGIVPEGRHLVQVYRPGGPAYDFPFDARAGETVTLPPPLPPSATPEHRAPPPVAKPLRRNVVGPYVLGHVGIAALTAKPFGFSYETVIDEDTGQPHERTGAVWYAGASGGYRLSRGIGLGGLALYARGGGEGEVTQVERTQAGGYVSHTGPAELLIQSFRLGPNVRFMAGGRIARFLGSISFGAVHHFIDLEHVDVIERNGNLVDAGTYHHDYNGWDPFFAFDLGAEFTVADHVLLGFSLDVMIDRTSGIKGNPYDDTAQGYIGFSARFGYADWTSSP